MRATPTREHARETTPARVLADGARELPAGAYGIWAAAGVALTALLGKVVFGEALNRTMLLGIGLIVVGVLLIELGAAH